MTLSKALSNLLQEFVAYFKEHQLEKRYETKPPKGQKEILAFYGDPASYKSPQRYWSKNGSFAHIHKGYDHIPFLRKHKGFWVHKNLKPMVERIFSEIERQGLAKYVTSFDGTYNHRKIRGRKRLSIHAFGAAIDINAKTNGLGTKGDMHPGIVEIFKSYGWTWGGDFKGRKDPMHFQYGGY